MIRSSLVSLAIAGMSFFPTASLLAQGSKAVPATPSNADTAKQDPQGADKRALEAELRALKEQSAELEALVKKLKQQSEQTKDAVARGDAERKAAVAQEREAVRKQQAAARAEQEARADKEAAERKKAAAERIARIEKRVAAEIARVKENAKKEIEKAKAEARAPQEERGFVVMENGDIAMFEQGQPTPPPARKRAAVAPMIAERIDGPGQGNQPQREDDDEPMFVMLDDVSEAHRTHKAEPGQEPASRSPMFARTKKVEGKPVERVVVEGKPAPQVWRATKVEPNEGTTHWFVPGEDGLPKRRVEVREHRIETNDDADSCCDCDCPMCGDGPKAPRQRQGREPERVREIRSRIADRRDEARRILQMRMEANEEDMEIERLLSELRRRLQSRRGIDRAPGMFEVRSMPIADEPAPQFVVEPEDLAAPMFVIDAEELPAPKKPATEVRRMRVKKTPDDEAPVEVRGVRIAPPPAPADAPPAEPRRARTKNPSKVAPAPMPPSAGDDGEALQLLPPIEGGKD